MTDNYQNIPSDLKELPQWVTRKGKVPINPHTGYGAKAGDQSTWGTFEQCVTVVKDYNGIGFEFNDNGIVGVDLDHVINDIGIVTPEALDIVKRLNSYTEISPSGTGLHIFVYGDIPEKGRKHTEKGIELYKDKRYFTVTGNVYGDLKPVEHRSTEIMELFDELFPQASKPQVAIDCTKAVNLAVTPDIDLLDKIRASKQGEKFKALYGGDHSQYPSQSDADMALCNILAFWCAGDAGLMDSIFRGSGLMRKKWDEKHGSLSYGQITINEALNKCTSFYTPKENYNVTITGNSGAEKREDLFFLIPKNKKDPDGEKKVHVAALVIFIRNKFRIKNYNGQFRILKKNFYNHVENMKVLISAQIPNYYRAPKNIEDCEKLLYYEQDMILKDEDLAPEKYIAFKNGILDVETMEFIDYNDPKAKALIFINQVDYNWDPLIKNDQKTDDFFNTITGGQQDGIDYLYQVLGVLMSNYRDFKHVFYFTGVKDSAKSQFLHICELLLTNSDGAKDFSSIGLKMLTDENSKELIGIIGKRANICAETPPLNIKNDTLIKQLSGGDFITLFQKFLGAITFKNKAMLIFAGNTVPNFFVSDKSSIGERLLIYKFKTAIPKEKQIPKVYKTLNMEYIIVRAVEQLITFVHDNQQFTIPDEVHGNRELMERESDSIYRFYKDCVVYTENKEHRINSRDLFTAYQHYLMDEGSIPKDPYTNKPDTRHVKLSQRSFIGKIKPIIGEGYHNRCVLYYDGKVDNCFTGIQLQNVHVNWDDQEYKIKLLK